jgi:polyisoprenoid-binding protein YceI
VFQPAPYLFNIFFDNMGQEKKLQLVLPTTNCTFDQNKKTHEIIASFFFCSLSFCKLSCGSNSNSADAQGAAAGDSTAVVYTVDATATKLGWTGSKLVGGSHSGNISISEGSIEVANGNIVSGTFTVDMSSLTNTDITDAETNGKLVGHLKSADFFNVDTFKTATFVISGATVAADSLGNSHSISGDLTIKGETRNITFPAKVSMSNGMLVMMAGFQINRTDWGLKYGSGSFFKGLGDNVINDNIDFTLNLTANAPAEAPVAAAEEAK